jgi:hypothetical protein
MLVVYRGSDLPEEPHEAECFFEPVERALRGKQRRADLAMVLGAFFDREVQEGLLASFPTKATTGSS